MTEGVKCLKRLLIDNSLGQFDSSIHYISLPNNTGGHYGGYTQYI
jgi:hypothetical protein